MATDLTSPFTLAEALVTFATGPHDRDHVACAEYLSERLVERGFEVVLHRVRRHPPLIEARRAARGCRGHVAMYGHYDTVGSARSVNDHLVERDGRWFARGIADDKGPLAVRMWALGELPHTPELTWLIQGEEETGSTAARELLPRLVAEADLWLDETGYHDASPRCLRLIHHRAGEGGPLPPDLLLEHVVQRIEARWAELGIPSRREVRALDKREVPGGCPFQAALPRGARYLALGVNDTASAVHRPVESMPVWAVDLHQEQLDVVFHALDEALARRGLA